MADPARQLLEDRALRDCARALVQGDIGFIRENLKARSFPARLGERASAGVRDIAGEATQVAREHALPLGAGLAAGSLALAAWVFREPLMHGLRSLFAALPTGEPEPAPDRSETI